MTATKMEALIASTASLTLPIFDWHQGGRLSGPATGRN